MNEPKHTPRKWELEFFREGDFRISHMSNKIVSGNITNQIYDTETMEANARLITASPLLLEVCQAVLEWAKAPGNHGGNPYMHKFVELAEQAIKETTK